MNQVKIPIGKKGVGIRNIQYIIGNVSIFKLISIYHITVGCSTIVHCLYLLKEKLLESIGRYIFMVPPFLNCFASLGSCK